MIMPQRIDRTLRRCQAEVDHFAMKARTPRDRRTQPAGEAPSNPSSATGCELHFDYSVPGFRVSGRRAVLNTFLSNWSARSPVLALLAAIAMWACAASPAFSQGHECELIPDNRNPSEKIMRCGDDLVVRSAPGTHYQPVEQRGNEQPNALRLDSGALMLELRPSVPPKDFQVLTPHAIAAVRGTKWIVEVRATRTSTLVLSGEVAVKRRRGEQTVVLHPGEGADVTRGTGSFTAKHWPRARVRALLARFGE
jgi:hypothetical protein